MLHRPLLVPFALAVTLSVPGIVVAQEMPPEYAAVLKTLGKGGDFKDGVLKVNIPRNDLHVTIDGRPAPTPFGFGGWLAFARGDDGLDVMMGDLVLTEDEVTPVMTAALAQGLDITALHNHFFRESPRIFYMHVHGAGRTADLTARVRPAVNLIGRQSPRKVEIAPPGTTPPPATPAANTGQAGSLDTSALARIVGHPGEQNGPVYKITIGRPDIDLHEHGARIDARMGLNTWAAFTGTDADAMVAGDVAMLAPEVTPVLKALRDANIEVVALHHHMTGTTPMVIFAHYYGTGRADALARGVRGAVDLVGKPAARQP